jgi:hydroxymethylglutaryl-CoA reductase
MTSKSSRLPGFHKLTLDERRELAAASSGIDPTELRAALRDGGLLAETADKIVENVLGTYALPFGLVLNVTVNAKDYLVPMVVEEPSVIAAASNAAKIVREGGGFRADVDPAIMIGQIELYDVADPDAGKTRILDDKSALLEIADRAVPDLCAHGGGARDLEIRTPAAGRIVVHLYVDCRDAMGANAVNTMAEAVGERVAALGGGTLGLRILSNLCDRRRAKIACSIPFAALATPSLPGEEVARRIAEASRFAEIDPYRAATHNKGIMNGIDAACIALGNDWRAIEAGAHAYAARRGRYEPLSYWRTHDGALEGRLDVPLAVGTVGGTIRAHPTARLALRLLGTQSAQEVAGVVASVGLASNLAALCALCTDGIQRGHMTLHARSVAVAAGATGDEVEAVARELIETRDFTTEGAARVLRLLRSGDASR